MNIFYPIKKTIIAQNFKKRKNQNPFDVTESETYQLNGTEPLIINNSYFFGGHSLKTKTSLVLRLGLRNSERCEIFTFYRNEKMFLVTPEDYYDAANSPLKCECIEPGKKWKVTFDGELMDKNDSSLHKVNFNFIFEARREIYDFFYSIQNPYMIRATARCKWTKEFPDEVRKNDQRHYEQSGSLVGEIFIDGVREEINLPGGRDHSYGNRNWDYMNDHIWLFAFKDNGEIFNYSIVNYPLLKDINCGWTDFNRDNVSSLKKINTLKYDHNHGLGPDEMELEIVFDDGKTSKIKVRRDANHETHYQDGDYYFQEGIGEFDIDGEKAYGCIEYGFNKNPSRWEIKNR